MKSVAGDIDLSLHSLFQDRWLYIIPLQVSYTVNNIDIHPSLEWDGFGENPNLSFIICLQRNFLIENGSPHIVMHTALHLRYRTHPSVVQ